jgi:hypothetical protein
MLSRFRHAGCEPDGGQHGGWIRAHAWSSLWLVSQSRSSLRMVAGAPQGMVTPKDHRSLRRTDQSSWASFIVETGHLPSWPLIEMRRP